MSAPVVIWEGSVLMSPGALFGIAPHVVETIVVKMGY